MRERKIPWWFQKPKEEARDFRKNEDTIISSVNDRLLRMLRKNMVPEVLESREEIGLCTPAEQGDMVLGIYLYDIQENEEMRINGMINDGPWQRFPPMYLNLFYMITAYSNVDLRYREEENHRILARVMELFHDTPILEGEEGLHLESQTLTMEQKMGIWHPFGTGYRLSLFYKIAPVKLNSRVEHEITRVKEIQIGTAAGMEEGV